MTRFGIILISWCEMLCLLFGLFGGIESPEESICCMLWYITWCLSATAHGGQIWWWTCPARVRKQAGEQGQSKEEQGWHRSDCSCGHKLLSSQRSSGVAGFKNMPPGSPQLVRQVDQSASSALVVVISQPGDRASRLSCTPSFLTVLFTLYFSQVWLHRRQDCNPTNQAIFSLCSK